MPGSGFACGSRVGENACEGLNNSLVINEVSKFSRLCSCTSSSAPLHVGSQNAVYDCRVPRFFRERGTFS